MAVNKLKKIEILGSQSLHEEVINSLQQLGVVQVVDFKNTVSTAGDLIEIQETDFSSRCECVGEVVFRFYKADTLAVQITLHHSSSIRFDEWRGDAMLSKESRRKIANWLSTRGVEGPKQSIIRKK